MSTLPKPPIRSHLNIVIDGMTQTELREIGRQLNALPYIPTISLHKMLPVHGNRLNARLDLAQATSDLGHIATHKIAHGSNPSVLNSIISSADATIVCNQNSQLALFVNHPHALGVSELMDTIPNARLQNEAHKEAEGHVYKKVFSAPIKSATTQAELTTYTPSNLHSPR